MTEFATFTGKNVDEAVNNALLQLQITSEKLEYEVVEKGSNGLLGFIGSKPAVIRARKKSDFIDEGEEFLQNIFREMNMEVDIAVAYNKEEQVCGYRSDRRRHGHPDRKKRTDTGFTAASGEPCYKQTQRRIYSCQAGY